MTWNEGIGNVKILEDQKMASCRLRRLTQTEEPKR
jgi:hypothetical protein